ncbi:MULTISPECIES: helix-turn-helix domain-containing protein [Streptomyces]|uniref:helix-turn-helix domain-containing protein n=1 Tax=Streptomyces TaxID=1883 RepID=UPI0004C5C06F|nr:MULTISPECIES: helix-turn-helix transcriptional regulator [unclassified Streptomyces]MCU4749304.1 helix-turn-helix domain-containing protein [Streptomyces sp. G-5]
MSGWKNAGNRVSTVLGRKLGGELLRLRVAAGKSRPDAGEALSAHPTKIVKMESGWVPMREPDIRVLCEFYDLTDESEIQALLDLARLDRERRKAKGWWQRLPRGGVLGEYIAMEDVATRIRTWQPSFIPGLFQTPEYIRAIGIGSGSWEDPEEIEPIVEVRQMRQQRLYSDRPLHLYAVVWEAALRQLVGGAEVMRPQLGHLLEVAKLPNVRLQVLPFRSGMHPSAAGPFSIISFAEAEAVDVIYADTLASSLWVENETESAKYQGFFEGTARLSLSAHDSLKLVEEIRQEM